MPEPAESITEVRRQGRADSIGAPRPRLKRRTSAMIVLGTLAFVVHFVERDRAV